MDITTFQNIRGRLFHVISQLLRNIDIPLIAFVFALCLFSFGYGVLVYKLKLFPHRLIENAAGALGAVMALEPDDLMPGVLALDDAAPDKPTITRLSASAGSEKLLIIGGPYQFMERCPTWGCLAWIIDRDGKVLHSWETDLDLLVKDAPAFAGRPLRPNIYPIGAALAPDGSLYLTFHGRNVFPYQVGIAKLDRAGRPLWRHFDHSHHWIALDTEGRVYAPSMRMRPSTTYFEETGVNVRCKTKIIYDEGVRVYSPDGRVLKEFQILDLFKQADYPGFFYGLRDDCDPAHLNSVDIATPAVAARLANVAPGDLLVSVRESSVITILDHETGAIKHLVAGRTAAQHSPKFLPDGSIAVFDNLGGDRALGGTRIARIDLGTDGVETIFPRDGETRLVPFYSGDGSHLSISPDGERLITSVKDQGRIIEIDIATGEPLWYMEKSFDIVPYLRKNHMNALADRARFIPYGAYYVSDTRFIAAPSLVETGDRIVSGASSP